MAPRVPKSIDKGLLGIYLSDHLTGSTAGVNRIRRMAEAHADSPLAEELARISTELVSERDFLKRLIRDLGLRRRRHRQAAAWLAERLGRLKLNGRVVRPSPLTAVLEAELMRAAVLGKLGGWQALGDLAPVLGLDPAVFDALSEDARGQMDVLGRLHEHARATAFNSEAPAP